MKLRAYSISATLVALSIAAAAPASADTVKADATVSPPEADSASIGGHLGLALPVFTIGGKSTVIGKDFFSLGVTPGVTVKLGGKWAVDFEFVAYNEFKATPSLTSFVVDPGVLYNFGPVVVGGRVATKLGGGQTTNLGVIPLVVLPFKLSHGLSYFIEGDVPIFFSDKETIGGTSSGVQPSVGFQFQTGVAF